jgi:hypothetical protein
MVGPCATFMDLKPLGSMRAARFARASAQAWKAACPAASRSPYMAQKSVRNITVQHVFGPSFEFTRGVPGPRTRM